MDQTIVDVADMESGRDVAIIIGKTDRRLLVLMNLVNLQAVVQESLCSIASE